ncbi:MAG: OmpA family protein [Stellaceae bacterium]
MVPPSVPIPLRWQRALFSAVGRSLRRGALAIRLLSAALPASAATHLIAAPSVPWPGGGLAALEGEPALGSVRFAPGGSELPADAEPVLDRLASRLDADGKSRVELLAYASGSNENSRARRLSLDRAIAVRAYLTARGVSQTRVIVRALGNGAPGSGGDRVDVVPLDP